MAWRRTREKPLPEPLLAQLTDAYMLGLYHRDIILVKFCEIMWTIRQHCMQLINT